MSDWSNLPKAVRLIEGEPTQLQIVTIKTARRTENLIAFANGSRNQYDSTLLLLDRAEIPVRTPDQAEPKFVGHKLALDSYPAEGHSVVVVPVMDTGLAYAMRKFFAREWTPGVIWTAAREDYKVLRWEKDGDKPTKVWDFSGIFELSYTFWSNNYDNRTGTIWSSDDGTVRYELVTCHQDDNTTWHVNPVHDPRIPLVTLPDEYRNRSLLANLR